MKQKRLILFFFLCVFYPAVSFAISVEEITKPLREKYQNFNTFTILYKQKIKVRGLDKTDEFKGRIIFSKPDRFRWEGVDNEGRKQIIIIVKQNMLMYLAETDTLTKRRLFGSFEKQLKNRYIPWLDLSNDMRTKYVDTEDEKGKKIYKLEILPESGDEYKNMFFWVDADKQDVVKIEVVDTAENHMTLFFDSTIFTQKVPEEEFVFKPEPKTKIMEINEE
ncbi:MAG: outer-membrane lipoprotein carrier protein LolA [bacterium]|nr:outer-membrane lipoprotein carrier protein LolA [bacterium]